MESPRCPRCGGLIARARRGRPRVWCSDDCRRRGHERGDRVHVRERVVTHETEILVPRTPDDAVALVLSDRDATVALLAELRRRIATTPITTDLERVTVRLVRQELTELTSACQRALADYAAPQSGTPVARLAGADLAPGLQRAERRRRKRTR